MENLIEPNAWYYHNRLRLVPSPPVSYVDDDGTIRYIGKLEPFYIKMVPSFTDIDLFEYYCEAFRPFGVQVTHPDDIKRYMGALAYLYRKYGLDVLLFTIDVAVNKVISEQSKVPEPPLELQDYVKEGIEALEFKKSAEITGSLHHYAAAVKKEGDTCGMHPR